MRFHKLLALFLVLTGCAATGGSFKDAYVGVASGKFSNVYYRLENSDLLIAYENATTLTMTNLVIVVEQETAGGSGEFQTNTGTLRMGQSRQLELKTPYNATGSVTVTSYFTLLRSGPLNMGMGSPESGADYGSGGEPGSDSVKFRIAR